MSAESRTGLLEWAIAFFGENEGEKMIFAKHSKHDASKTAAKKQIRWE